MLNRGNMREKTSFLLSQLTRVLRFIASKCSPGLPVFPGAKEEMSRENYLESTKGLFRCQACVFLARGSAGLGEP